MGEHALKERLGIDESELSQLSRIADRLLIGRPTRPHGTSPRALRAGRGLEFLEHRSYGPGDEARDVDWRATARARRLLVRRRQDEALFAVFLCLDRSSSMAIRDSAKWRLAHQIAAALAYLLLHGGSRVALLGFGESVDVLSPAARGRSAFSRIVKGLLASFEGPKACDSRLQECSRFVTPGASVFVISDFLAPDQMKSGIEPLRRLGTQAHAIQVLSSHEVALDAVGRCVLRDAETGERRELHSAASGSGVAREKLAQLRRELVAYCRGRGIPVTSCDAGAGWRGAVLAHVLAVA